MTYGRVKPSKNTSHRIENEIIQRHTIENLDTYFILWRSKTLVSTCSVNPFRRLYEGGTWDTDIEWKVGKLFQDRWWLSDG